MRTKKIRGHKRRWKGIDHWIQANKKLDLENLFERQRDYVKIRVHPWSGMYMGFRRTPQLRGKTKAKILNGLIEIYDTWKMELDKLGEKYYLKIWLFEPRFSTSQVVCAIRDKVAFYDETFYKPDTSKKLNTQNYRMHDKLSKFEWDYRFDEDMYEDDFLGSPNDYQNVKDYLDTEIFLRKMMKRPHRTYAFKEPIGRSTETYYFKMGDLWLGEK